ncbi:neuropeptide SIFamide receptor [Nematostella vectensis]|uniref:neuropeptide SIFamide receptor n=1 Tax=Nematostella vectensis TaxID=45351 RepID=UPI0020773689|nr:neuropeptide SIFamide receptor [Nematostella vectensis]
MMNLTRNSSVSNSSLFPASNCAVTVDTDAARTTKTFAFCAIFVAALIANLLVVIVFAKTKSLQKGINYFLVNMAVSDIIMPLFLIPRELLELYQPWWLVGGGVGLALCKLQPFLIDVCSAVSVLSMVGITIDRFRAVVLPLRTSVFEGRRHLFIISSWVVAMIIFTPYLYANRLGVTLAGDVFCFTDWTPLGHFETTSAMIVVIIVLFGAIPWVLITALYGIIIVELKHSRVRVAAHNEGPLRQPDRSISVIKQALAISAAFSLCYFPLVAMYFVVAFVNKFVCSPLPYWGHLWFTARFLVISNTVINPCICLFFNENYRNGLRGVVRVGVARSSTIEMGATMRPRAETRTIDTA